MAPPHFLVGYQLFERHLLAASLAYRQAARIPDVGGRSEMVTSFAPIPATVTNLAEGDVHSNGLPLPFDDSTFDIVTSIDVSEHVPRHNRPRFMEELGRGTRLQVVRCTPIGSPAHT